MFTGLIQELGRVKDLKRTSLEVLSQLRCEPGDSVAVNGACLTVVPNRTPGVLRFDVSHETWRLTNLGALEPGSPINLEPALRAGEALGGHMVSGHVDARGAVLLVKELPGGFVRLRVERPAALRGLMALKGSVAVDGVSLTVTALSAKWFETVLVPHTLARTNLGGRRPGDVVNLEADLIARYVRAALGKR